MQTLAFGEFERTAAYRQLSSQQRDELQHWFEGSVTTTFVVLDSELVQIWDQNEDWMEFRWTSIMCATLEGNWKVGTRQFGEKPTNQTLPHFVGDFNECVREVIRLSEYSYEEVN